MVETGLEIEEAIRSLISGRWFIETLSKDPTRKLLSMRHPTLRELQLCDFHKKCFIDQNRDTLMSMDEARSKAFIHGVWLPGYDEQMDALAERLPALEEQEHELIEQGKKAVAFRSRARIVRKEIDRMTNKLDRLIERKQAIFGATLEFAAEKKRLFRLVGCVTEFIDGTPVWGYGAIDDECDEDLLHELANSLVENLSYDVAQIRQVARSNLWRYRWSVGKKNIKHLFGRDIADFSQAQQELLFWSEIYDSAIESYEPPPSHIVNNDEMFDKWLSDRCTEAENKKAHTFYKMGDFKGNENFVVVSGEYDKDGYWREYTREEKDAIANRVYGQNPPVIRAMQKGAKARIDKHGGAPVSERHLRRGYFKVLGWDKLKGQEK
jgi:hypothetical protein